MSKPRYPPIRYGEDGKKRCRGCGGAIGRGRQTWCSQECREKYDPRYILPRVYKRSGGKCENCKRDFSKDRLGPPEFHHVIPFSEGGETTDENLRTICRDCHLEATAKWRREKAMRGKPIQEVMSL